MTSIESLLSELGARDVRVWVEGEKLRLDTPQGGLTPELKAELTARKPELIAYLTAGPAANGSIPAGRGSVPITPPKRSAMTCASRWCQGAVSSARTGSPTRETSRSRARQNASSSPRGTRGSIRTTASAAS